MKKNILIHVGAVLFCLLVSCVYFAPALSGKQIRQGDVQKYESMSYQQRREKDRTGIVPNWTRSMFSGMPGYHVTSKPQKSIFQPVRNTLNLTYFGGERHVGILFLYLLGFYVALLAFGCSWWLALLGALSFGLASYNIIIIEAGHINKGFAMSMMAPILAGMWLVLNAGDDKRKARFRMLWGGLLFTLALILQISFNHIQITSYTAMACVAMGLVYAVQALRKKQAGQFLLKLGVLAVGAALAFGCNTRMLLVNAEYAKYTMRGGNELTVTPADLYENEPAAATQNTSTGLNIDYAFSWSYGIGETYTLLVPGAVGGGSGERVDKESASYKNFRIDQAPLYWGDQPFTSGPVYFGAVVMLLALLGMLVAKGPDRWWILAAMVFAILLSWGRNFMPFNQWMFDHLPLYNKFRTPSMSLVLANVCLVIVAVLGLQALVNAKSEKTDPQLRRRQTRALYIATGVTGGIILLGLLLCGGFSFSGASDAQMASQYGAQWPSIQEIFIRDRKALFVHDSWRSLIFVLLAATSVWLYLNDKFKKAGWMVAALTLLVVVDLWGVDRRYLNEENFVAASKLELRPQPYDYEIDRMAAQYGDYEYRVLNMAVNTFNDSDPSAFHDQVGGYSAAKLSRYQNLIDFYIGRHINPAVINMLNTRYVVLQNGQVQRNPEALGNCWFVREVKTVGSADEEILALNNLNPAVTAVVDTCMWKVSLGNLRQDSSATIALVPQQVEQADYKKYVSHSHTDQLAVFSEIHYQPDWLAYLDGEPVEYIRANYVLRAMVIPAGDHVIEFCNEAPRLMRLDKITLTISILTLLGMIGVVALVYRRDRKDLKVFKAPSKA